MKKSLNIFIEIGPILHEKFYSGIPNVVVHLIDELSKVSELELFFFHGHSVMDSKVVFDAVKLRSSIPFREAEAKGSLVVGNILDITKNNHGINASIFTNVRHGLERIFDYELQIVYDLTPLVTPQYHHPDTVNFYNNTYCKEYLMADRLFCISHATKRDLELYLPAIDTSKISHSLLAGEKVSDQIDSFYKANAKKINVEPFVMILGTVEPRKNLSLLFEMFNESPELLSSYKWVFCGKDGWLLDFNSLVNTLNDNCQPFLSNIVRLNYIEEFEKITLLRKAEFLVFPSMYEGFGLPVLEALQEGCPVVASFSSSVPEAGGDVSYYFDPTSSNSLESAIQKVRHDLSASKRKLKKACVAHSKEFSWQKFAIDLLAEIEKDLF